MTIAAPRRSRLTLWQIFAVPLVIGAQSAVGLVAALVGDGPWDGLSWVTLAIPAVLFVAFVFWSRNPARR